MADESSEPETSKLLDRSLISGMAWTALLRWVAQLISWAGTLYAARVFVPGDYGLVAMGMVPIGLMRMVEDFGLDSVLLQSKSIDTEQQARLAGLALLFGATCTVIFIALSEPLATFFHEPSVAAIISGLSVLFLLDALQIVPKAGLQRRLEFKRLAFVWLAQTAFTTLTLIVGAYLRWGYWALVLNTIAGSAAATLLLLWWHPYSIAWPRRLSSLSTHLRQGWRVLVSRATWYAYTSADQTVIGRELGKDLLGAYSFATTFSNLPNQELSSVVSRVVPGIFTNVQDSPAELKRYFLILTEFISYFAFPIAVGIACVADVAMLVILGPQWTAVAMPLRILCIYSAFNAAQILVAHVLLWTGQFRALMWCSILTAVVLPPGFYFAAPYGIAAIAWIWSIFFPLTNIPPLVLAFRTLKMSFGTWLESLRPAAVGSAVMCIAVLGTRFALRSSPSVALVFGASILVGAIVYAASMWLLFRSRLMAIVDTVKAARR